MEANLTVREWLTKNRSKYGKNGEAAAVCAAELKVAKKTVFNMMATLKRNGRSASPPSAGEARLGNIGLSEKELRSKHDSLYKLEQAVKILTSGKFIPEPEFRATVNIDPSKFRSKSDLPQFDVFKGRVAGVTYWGNPKDIKRLKDEGVFS